MVYCDQSSAVNMYKPVLWFSLDLFCECKSHFQACLLLTFLQAIHKLVALYTEFHTFRVLEKTAYSPTACVHICLCRAEVRKIFLSNIPKCRSIYIKCKQWRGSLMKWKSTQQFWTTAAIKIQSLKKTQTTKQKFQRQKVGNSLNPFTIKHLEQKRAFLTCEQGS